MTVHPELLKLLVCPETKQPLKPADAMLLEKVNLYISQGKMMNKSGESLIDQIQGGLITQDEKTLYIIKDDIPIMLVEESVRLHQISESD